MAVGSCDCCLVLVRVCVWMYLSMNMRWRFTDNVIRMFLIMPCTLLFCCDTFAQRRLMPDSCLILCAWFWALQPYRTSIASCVCVNHLIHSPQLAQAIQHCIRCIVLHVRCYCARLSFLLDTTSTFRASSPSSFYFAAHYIVMFVCIPVMKPVLPPTLRCSQMLIR